MGRGKPNNLKDKRFGRLYVVKKAHKDCKNNVYWECLCHCGKTVFILGSSLKAGHTKSCGCLKKEILKTCNLGRKSEKLIDLTGEKFNRWTVIKKGISKNSHTMWVCQCECGTIKTIAGSSLKSKKGCSKSCGCYEKENPSRLKHGGSKTRIYNIWNGLKIRCYNPNWHAYHRYGGRGIKICEEWLNNFPAFREWALSSGYSTKLTLDRINRDKGYSPNNCRWVSQLEQVRNSSIAKLNIEKVKKIKKLLPLKKLTQKEIGKMFGVSGAAIQKISGGKNWKDV